MAQRRIPRTATALGVVLLLLVLLAVFWRWDWFIPLVEARASAALGRPVTIAHLHVSPGRVTRIVADDVQVANPDGFPPESRFATIDHLGISVDLWSLIRGPIVIPAIDVDHPVVAVATGPKGEENWHLGAPASDTSPAPAKEEASPGPRIGALTITDGKATVKVPKMKADFAADIETKQNGDDPAAAQLLVSAKGTYAGQPITGRFVGGALLSLRDADKPYPIDLRVENGPTKVALVGTVQDPLAFKGTNVKLTLQGADMSALYPLTGIPIPETPPYKIAGDLSYSAGRIHFDKFTGVVGNSDLNGSIHVDPGKERPVVDADLTSRRVDLADLGGFIGGTPGKASTAQTAQQKREQAASAASATMLPDQPFNIHVRYKAQRIEGNSMPLDNLETNLDIVDGAIRLHPLRFGVGKGRIDSDIAIDERGNVLVTKATVDFNQVDLARMLASTHLFDGFGKIGGRIEIDTTGNSIAKMMANGNGSMKLFMTGGDLSALLVDLAGLDFGSAVASALGIPSRTPIRCMVVDLPLQKGVLTTRTMLLDTEEANITGKGSISFRDESLNLELEQEAKHFTVGSLPGPIYLKGRFKSPSIVPSAETAARGAAAGVLGALLTPLAALVPTIQFGLGEDNDCNKLINAAAASGRNKLAPGQIKAKTGR